MNVLCPFCQKPIMLSDTEAGKAVNCPLCQQAFAAPKLYVAPPLAPAPALPPSPPPSPRAPEPPFLPTQVTSIDPLPAPYKLVDPLPVVADPTPPSASAPAPVPPVTPPQRWPVVSVEQELSGLQHVRSLPLDPNVLRYLPAGAFFLLFILSFFSWVGIYPGGHAAYTQNAWQCLFADMSEDAVAEEEMKVGKELGDTLKSNWWLLPYLVLLIPAFVLAIAGPVLALTQPKFPPVVHKILQFRPVLLAALAIFTMLFFAAQWSRGFGLERAVREKVDAQFAEDKAKLKTPEQEKRWELKYGATWNHWSVRTTTALRFAFFLHLLAAFAVAAEAALQLRGNKPPPRIGVMW